jgi:glucose-6-phosphate dehydrogenase assembly protein OpcA
MADESSSAFLDGIGVSVELPEIEAKLAELWGPAAAREGGPDVEKPALTRVVLANVAVAVGPGDSAVIHEILPIVEAHFPCRAIVLERTERPERRVFAEVSAVCHLPVPGMPQVCSERIILSAGPNARDLLPGAVRPLLEADLPFVLWWVDDPRVTVDLLDGLARESSRILVQLPDPATDPEALRIALDPARCPHSRDLAWFGATRWRELVAQFFDTADAAAALSRIEAVTIDAESPSGERAPRVAAWLAAWLTGQLGWSRVERRELGEGRLEATFTGPHGPVSLAIQTRVCQSCDLARITGISLTTGGTAGQGTYRVARVSEDTDDARIETKLPGHPCVPRLVKVDDFDLPRRVAAGLESARDDPPFCQAMPHMLWLLGVEPRGKN